MSLEIRAFLPFAYGVGFRINKLLLFFIFSAFWIGTLAPLHAEPARITVLGDSLVQGYGLPGQSGFVPQLERWLREKGYDVSLLNAGVSGDTTAGGLSRIAWTLSESPDALIVSLGGNDVLRGTDPAVTRKNLAGVLQIASEKEIPLLLIGIIAPRNYGEDYKVEFEEIYTSLADEFGTLLYPNFLKALTDLPSRAETLSRYYQADSIHPNADGVALIVNDMGPIVAKLIEQIPDNGN